MDGRLQKAVEERLQRLQRAAAEGDVDALFSILAEERLQRLQRAAAEGDVDALYSILAEEPLVLERFDEKAFLSTPLHTAVREGKIQFAKEIVNLKPSFVYKRDHLGLSPLHLALKGRIQELKERSPPHLALKENYQETEGRGPDMDLEGKYQELVTWLIQIDSELVHVKARGMVTPLHYAAEIDDESNLADFLYVCPSSIQDLTVECETAVHVALKKASFRSFKELLVWLRRFDKEDILSWEDKDGNNALHTAISENQPEAVKLLIKYMEVNKKNGKGLTALDIFYDRQDSLNPEVGEILRGAKAKRASQLHRQRKPLKPRFRLLKSVVDNFRGDLSFTESILKRLRLGDQSIKNVPLKVRNVVLVVAVLIATATYQAAISPPGGYWQDDGNVQLADNSTAIRNTTTTIFGTGPSKERVGHMILGSSGQLFFLIFNILAFFTSVCSLLIFMIGLPFSGIIITSTSLMVASFSMAIVETSSYHKDSVVGYLFFIFLFVSGTAAYYIPTFIYVQGKMLTIQGRQRKLRLGRLEVQTT